MSVVLNCENKWLSNFLCEKSGIELNDETVSRIAKSVLKSESLKSLVKERFDSGVRFCGWTKDGSRGFTEVSSGNIYIGKSGNEPVTLGYECVNSQNKKAYKKIGVQFAFEETTQENRKKFAEAVLKVEAVAMLMKCRLVTEMGLNGVVKDHYLNVFTNQNLEEEEKIESISSLMKQKGLVHFTKPAYEFYMNERYDEFVQYYRDQIKIGAIC